MQLKIFLGLIIAVSVISCKNNSSSSERDDKLASEATTQVIENPMMAAADFNAKLSASTGAQVVDVRTAGEFESGHLNNAVNMDIFDPAFEKNAAGLDKSKPIFVYCQRGNRSTDAAGVFRNLGFKQVYELDGGLIAWERAGLPLAGAEAAEQAAGSEMSKEQFDNLLNTDKYVLVDFNAKWCGPCKVLSPIVDKIAAEKSSKVQLVKIDVDENTEIANAFGISSIPLLHLYKDKKLVWKNVGLVDKETIEKHIQ